jgi:hypothetical protein
MAFNSTLTTELVDDEVSFDKNVATGYQVLGVFTWLFSWTSAACALYIMRESYRLRVGHRAGALREQAPIFLTNHVFWMCFCDVIQQFWLGYVWMSVAFKSNFNNNWSQGTCWTIGSIAQFFLVGSAAWNFTIAVLLLRVLTHFSIHTFEKEIPYHHAFVWGVSFICWLAPWVRPKGVAYGYVANIEHKYGFAPFECWISVPDYQLCLYIPAMVFVFSAGFLLLVTILKAYRGEFQKTREVVGRLSLYTIVFVLTWTFPIALRLRGTLTSTEPHPFLVWAHHISLSVIGMGNAFVWGRSQQMRNGAKGDSTTVHAKSTERSKDLSQFADMKKSTSLRQKVTEMLSVSDKGKHDGPVIEPASLEEEEV